MNPFTEEGSEWFTLQEVQVAHGVVLQELERVWIGSPRRQRDHRLGIVASGCLNQ